MTPWRRSTSLTVKTTGSLLSKYALQELAFDTWIYSAQSWSDTLQVHCLGVHKDVQVHLPAPDVSFWHTGSFDLFSIVTNNDANQSKTWKMEHEDSYVSSHSQVCTVNLIVRKLETSVMEITPHLLNMDSQTVLTQYIITNWSPLAFLDSSDSVKS